MHKSYITDTHCHIHYSPLIEDIDNVVLRAEQNNVKRMICVSVDVDDYKKINTLIKKGNIYQSIGIHPLSAKKYSTNEINIYLNSDVCENLVAVGETGLDNFREPLDSQQINSFLKHIEFSLQKDLPIIMHTRCAPDDNTVEIESKAIIRDTGVTGVAHCFGGSWDFAQFLVSQGWYISFAGNITYKKSEDLRDIIKMLPLDRILIETDSPYLSPEPYRGQTNEPSHVVSVLNKIAEIKNIRADDLQDQLHENTNKLFFR
jgi:TatD DNase family protein